jgi:hypothetical protein
MPTLAALSRGAAGAAAMTLSFFALEKFTSHTPQFDKIGMRGLEQIYRAAGARPPRGDSLRRQALGADLVTNTLYFARSVGPDASLARGALFGLMAGLGTLVAAPAIGVPKRQRGRSLQAKALTVGIYVVGGLVAAAVGRLARRQNVP